uniref:F-box domain-containing protein n=1 Tax=Hordeum vulgare subsp. vulgare TaxID=112509 RepID=A0A8I6YBN3_HORVV
MEACCSVARTVMFAHFGLRIMPKLLALSPDSLRKFRKVSPPKIVARKLPELPQDVLMEIFSLLEIPDLIRAASVSTSWRCAYTSLCSQLGVYKRPQTPCLLYTSESAGENVACLYSLAEKRVYNLTLPDPPIRSRYLIGSSHGWLVTADDKSELHLINPITGQQIALPPVITIDYVEPIFDDAGTIIKYGLLEQAYYADSGSKAVDPKLLTYALDELRDHLYVRAFIFPDPSAGSYIVVLIHGPEGELSFARIGDCKWTLLPPGWDYKECIYMHDLLYAFTATGRIDAFNLTGPTVTRNIIIDDIDYYFSRDMWYVVQAPCGGLLQVCRVR